MKVPCIATVDLGRIAAAPPDDPRRQHLASCPRCRALLRQYQAFMNPEPLPAAARSDQAETLLARRLAQEIGTPGGVIVPLRPRRPRLAVPSPALWATAALLVACAGIFLARDLAREMDPRVPPGPAVLRGEADAPAALAVTPVSVTPVAGAPGAWQLAWTVPAGAEASVVILYDAALRELGRRDVGPDTALTLDARAWPAAQAAAYVGVAFFAGGDEVGRASARALAAN